MTCPAGSRIALLLAIPPSLCFVGSAAADTDTAVLLPARFVTTSLISKSSGRTINCAAVNPDGDCVAFLTDNRLFQVVELSSGQTKTHTFEEQLEASNFAIVFSPSGGTVTLLADKRTHTVFDLQFLRTLYDRNRRATSAPLLHGGVFLEKDQTIICLPSTHEMRVFSRYDIKSRTNTDMYLNPKPRKREGGAIQIRDTFIPKAIILPSVAERGHFVFGTVYDADGTIRPVVYHWNDALEQLQEKWLGEVGSVRDYCLSPHRNYLAFSTDDAIYVLDMIAFHHVRVDLRHDEPSARPRLVGFSTAGSEVYTHSERERIVRVREAASGILLSALLLPQNHYPVVPGPGRASMLLRDPKGQLWIYCYQQEVPAVRSQQMPMDSLCAVLLSDPADRAGAQAELMTEVSRRLDLVVTLRDRCLGRVEDLDLKNTFKDLASNQFRVRIAAKERLVNMGVTILPAVRREKDQGVDGDYGSSVESVLAAIRVPKARERIRQARMIGLLTDHSSHEATRLLKDIAELDKEAYICQQALIGLRYRLRHKQGFGYRWPSSIATVGEK